MTKFLKKVVILSVLLVSADLFAQDDLFNKNQEKAFHPKFTLGSGIYTLTGDIQNEEKGLLKGREGFNAGMKFDIAKNLDLSFLFIKSSFSGSNENEKFNSEVDGLGLHLGYSINNIFNQSKIIPIVSLGAQRLRVATFLNDEEKPKSSVFTIPLGLGLRMNVTERLQFDITMNFGMGMGDIDNSIEGNADGYKSLNFTIHYDLFSPDKNSDDYFDDSYYADVDFLKLESEDEDGDLVRDMDDYCPKTPIGVKVDKNGCPLDDDKDGIPNYLDQQKNTVEGSLVDENGVSLTADKYHSTYSDLEVASRKYANFYNDLEIKRENYKTIDEYLIAKANAFNKAYNESLNDNSEVKALIYRIKIGEFKDGMPASTANTLLSFDDLESFIMDDDAVIYTVGTYATYDDAIDRIDILNEKGFDDTYVMVDNNGEISDYIKPVLEVDFDESAEVTDSIEENQITDTTEVIYQGNDSIGSGGVVKSQEIVNETFDSNNGTTYRIQIGAFKKSLSDEVFVGVDNVISFTGKDGWIRYMAGSFADYKDAVDYQAQMQARGFSDAFVVTFKNGERIGLNVAIKQSNDREERNSTVIEDPEEVVLDLEFIVQIMVAEESVSADALEKMSRLGNFDKQAQGSDMYIYYAGTYSDLEEANIQLEKAKQEGFSNAFIFVNLRTRIGTSCNCAI